jgi:hypothetical protein
MKKHEGFSRRFSIVDEPVFEEILRHPDILHAHPRGEEIAALLQRANS